MRRKRINRYVRNDGTPVRSHLRKVNSRRMRLRNNEERKVTGYFIFKNGKKIWIPLHQWDQLRSQRLVTDDDIIGTNLTMNMDKHIRLRSQEVRREDVDLPPTEHVTTIAGLAAERARYSRVSEHYDPSFFETLDRATITEADILSGNFKHKTRKQRDRRRNFGLSADFEQQATNLYRKASTETPSQAADTVEIAQNLQSMAKAVEVAAPLSSDEELAIRRHWNLGKHKKRTKVI